MKDITSKWSKIITENKERQRDIQHRIDALKNSASMVGGAENHGDEKRDAFIQFIEDVDEVLGHVLNQYQETQLDDVSLPDDDKRSAASTPMVREKRSVGKSRKSKCTLSSFTPQEIERRARAMNLMDFPSFVRLLNTINKAGRGALDQPQN